ncbi:unnamed protein product [Leptidea sinapis]|uniref:Uncharacterized protein n=1 Tax=Leptidea sinapis TaxID=189913 RepID=A0A5E4PPX4_9NEOP|nr:unnamed protein product [Leptidea sinapis]
MSISGAEALKRNTIIETEDQIKTKCYKREVCIVIKIIATLRLVKILNIKMKPKVSENLNPQLSAAAPEKDPKDTEENKDDEEQEKSTCCDRLRW